MMSFGEAQWLRIQILDPCKINVPMPSGYIEMSKVNVALPSGYIEISDFQHRVHRNS